MSENPYQAPRTPVEDFQPEPAQEVLLREPRLVPAGHGAAWYGQCWSLFVVSPGIWMIFAAVLIVMAIGATHVPYIGPLVQFLAYPFFFAGVAAGADAVRRGQPLSLAHLVAGLAHQTRPLLVLGAIYGVASLVISVGALMLLQGSVFQGVSPIADPSEISPELLLVLLLAMSVNIPLLMAMWFAPILVYLHGMPPAAAMRLSFYACARNLAAFLVYGMVAFLLAFAATVPMLLGWFVLFPVFVLSAYIAYRDLFFQAA